MKDGSSIFKDKKGYYITDYTFFTKKWDTFFLMKKV